jgi:hypothetical protein
VNPHQFLFLNFQKFPSTKIQPAPLAAQAPQLPKTFEKAKIYQHTSELKLMHSSPLTLTKKNTPK